MRIGAGRAAPARPDRHNHLVARDLLVLIAVFVVASALAGLLGAANLGTALTFGTIGFTGTLVAMMLLRDRDA